MPAKKTYTEVSSLFIENGYILVSTEYVNSKKKLVYICPRGHKGEITYGSFLSGCRCKKCKYVNMGNKFKTGIEEIKKQVTKDGYELISDLYKNAHSNIVLRCPEGHLWDTTWHSFRKGCRCVVCNGTSRNGFKMVSKEVEKNGYAVYGKYVNNRSNLTFICPNKHKWVTTWKSFNSGNRCPECGRSEVGKKLAVPLDYIKNAFEYEGYSISSEVEYKNNKDKFLVTCPKGHDWNVCWNDFQQGHRCSRCSYGPVSEVSQLWLDSVGIPVNFREYSLQDLHMRVDGFDPETNTVYEFLGDYWHGNPEIYNKDDINPHNKKSYGDLYCNTLKRLKSIKDAGYLIHCVWEQDYNTGKLFSVLLRNK